jgi:hypothetical protein
MGDLRCYSLVGAEEHPLDGAQAHELAFIVRAERADVSRLEKSSELPSAHLEGVGGIGGSDRRHH